MGLFDQATSQPNQGLMGLGQPQRNRAQGTEVNGQFVPTFSNPDGSYMSEGMMVNPQQPQGNMPLMRDNFGGAGVNFNIPNGQPQPMPSPQYPTPISSNIDNVTVPSSVLQSYQ